MQADNSAIAHEKLKAFLEEELSNIGANNFLRFVSGIKSKIGADK